MRVHNRTHLSEGVFDVAIETLVGGVHAEVVRAAWQIVNEGKRTAPMISGALRAGHFAVYAGWHGYSDALTRAKLLADATRDGFQRRHHPNTIEKISALGHAAVSNTQEYADETPTFGAGADWFWVAVNNAHAEMLVRIQALIAQREGARRSPNWDAHVSKMEGKYG